MLPRSFLLTITLATNQQFTDCWLSNIILAARAMMHPYHTVVCIMNITAAWIAILIGFIEGAVIGLFFHKEDWLGGYSSWTRRLMRLGHISLFGLAFINIAFAWSVKTLDMSFDNVALSSYLFLSALVTMPLVCHCCAFYKPLRHLFFIPVGCLIFGAAFFLYAICGRVE